ncbi:MAG: hypothetical protein ACTSW1_16505 [Candidatus Hodarchaeales archaeon]
MNKKVFGVGGAFTVCIYRKKGENLDLVAESEFHNLYPSEGLDYILSSIFKGHTPSDPLYVGLLGGTVTPSPSMDWKMANQGSLWDEFTSYSEGTRQEFVDGPIDSAHQISNTDNKAQFTITGAGTIYGAFLCTDPTLDGTMGTLVCIGTFVGTARVVQPDDIVRVTYTVAGTNA